MNKGSVYRVAWENQQAHASSCDEVDALLNRLVTEYQGDKAVFVTITRTATGDSLKLGVGRERTVLDYVPGDLEPPYHASLGDPNESGSLVFRYEGEWTEV